MKEQKEKLKLFIMDDSDIFRAGLVQILGQEGEGFELSGCGEYSDETETRCTEAAPDVLIAHSSMKEMDDHLRIIGGMKHKMDDTRILVIAEYTDVDYLLKIAVSCCDGYVHNGISKRSLARVIRNLANDVYIFDRAIINKMLLLKDERRAVKREDFSPRERKIVEMLAEGKGNAAIGKEMSLSGGTVKNIVSDMLKRHHLKNRAQLVNVLGP